MAYTDAEQLMMQGFEPTARASTGAVIPEAPMVRSTTGLHTPQAPAGALYGPRGGQYVPMGYAESGIPYPTGNGFMHFMLGNMARPIVNGGPRNFDATLLMAPMWNYDNTVNAGLALAQQMMQSFRDPSFLKMMQGMMRPVRGGGGGVSKQPDAKPDPNKMTPLERYLHNQANRAARPGSSKQTDSEGVNQGKGPNSLIRPDYRTIPGTRAYTGDTTDVVGRRGGTLAEFARNAKKSLGDFAIKLRDKVHQSITDPVMREDLGLPPLPRDPSAGGLTPILPDVASSLPDALEAQGTQKQPVLYDYISPELQAIMPRYMPRSTRPASITSRRHIVSPDGITPLPDDVTLSNIGVAFPHDVADPFMHYIVEYSTNPKYPIGSQVRTLY